MLQIVALLVLVVAAAVVAGQSIASVAVLFAQAPIAAAFSSWATYGARIAPLDLLADRPERDLNKRISCKTR